jgi:uncharacterized protein YcbK (DUF882 family)
MNFKYFSIDEFECSETGYNEISVEFVTRLDELRELAGFGFNITSGYRSPMHSVEAKKPNGPGQHTLGIACDIAVNGGNQRFTIIEHALDLGFTGIGVAKTFVHVDTRQTTPVIWSY